MRLALAILFFTATFAAEPDQGRLCKRGERGSPTIRYYWDTDRFQVYPFLFLGCGGKGGHYHSRDEAIVSHFNDKGSLCPGYKNGTKCNHSGFICPSSSQKCRIEAFSYDGQCCDTNEIKAFELSRTPNCTKQGGSVQKYPWTNEIYFGRKCAHNFCSKGATCVDGTFNAYCCVRYTFV